MSICLKILFAILSIAIPSCSRPHEDQLFALTESYSQKLSRRGLFQIGQGGALMERIEELSLLYLSHAQLQIEQVRSLLISCVDGLLSEVNRWEGIRGYLSPFPFTMEQLEFGILFKNPSGKFVGPAYVASASLWEGKIHYYFYDPMRQELVSFHEESYEKAVEQIESNHSTIFEATFL